MAHLNFISTCWWVFFLIWIISAFRVKPTKERQPWGGRLFTIAFVAISLLLLDGRIPPEVLQHRIGPENRALRLLGEFVTFAGLVISLWARLSLGTNWSATVTFREGHELIQRGPYRYVRHPMYTGLLLMIVGTAVVIANLAGVLSLIICFAGSWWKLGEEEKLLCKHFPDSYPAYKRRTKALIPFFL